MNRNSWRLTKGRLLRHAARANGAKKTQTELKMGLSYILLDKRKTQRLIDIMRQNNWMYTRVTSKVLFSFFIVH